MPDVQFDDHPRRRTHGRQPEIWKAACLLPRPKKAFQQITSAKLIRIKVGPYFLRQPRSGKVPAPTREANVMIRTPAGPAPSIRADDPWLASSGKRRQLFTDDE